jgi:hypothetical protein
VEIRRSFAQQAYTATALGLVFFLSSGIDSIALAANHIIPANEDKFSCVANSVRPGDTIVISGRSRGSLAITDCTGTANAPIKIRNDTTLGGPLVISRTAGSGGGFIFHLMNLQHVVIDGTGGWNGSKGSCSGLMSWPAVANPGSCGIKVTITGGNNPSSYVHVGGTSKNLTIKGIEIDGAYPSVSGSEDRGTGLQINEHLTEKDSGYPYSDIEDPVDWRENIVLTNNYIHNIPSSCIYDGPNFSSEQESEWKLRNHDISYNRIDGCGNDAIKLKVCWGYDDGICEVHHNLVTRIGIRNDSLSSGATDHCILIWEGNGKVYNNRCINNLSSPNTRALILAMTQQVPSSLVSPVLPNGFQVEIFNNVVHQAAGAGIAIDRRSTKNADIDADIYNNTVVGTNAFGIHIASDINAVGTIRNNIVAGETISAGKYRAFNNNTQSVASQKFRNAGSDDFHLTASSPARNSDSSSPPSMDHDNVARMADGDSDVGAFDFVPGGDSSKRPLPPELLSEL